MRFGFVGLGTATRSLHLPALASIPGAVAVGGCDAQGAACRRFESETGLPTYSSIAELVGRGGLDVAVIANPPDSHADLCLGALEAGAHVLCAQRFTPTLGGAVPVPRDGE